MSAPRCEACGRRISSRVLGVRRSARGFAIRPKRMRLNKRVKSAADVEARSRRATEAIVNRWRSIDVVKFRDVRNGRAIHAIGRSRHAKRHEHCAPQIVVEGLSGASSTINCNSV